VLSSATAHRVRYNRRDMSQRIPTARKSRAADKQIIKFFENIAGRYELVHVERGRAHYKFTNRDGKVTEAVMPLAAWLRAQARSPLRDCET